MLTLILVVYLVWTRGRVIREWLAAWRDPTPYMKEMPRHRWFGTR